VALLSQHFTNSTSWCVAVQNTQGSVQTFKYSAANGLEGGADCVSGTDY
jgi:hypothetical protein